MIQIIAKDAIDNVLIILTWDLTNNREVNILQIRPDKNTYPENYIVKGLNQKFNYLVG